MAAPFIVLGGKGVNYLVDKHFDKVPQRALHIHDPKKKARKREEREARRRDELGAGAAGGAIAGDEMARDSDSEDDHAEDEHAKGRTFDEDDIDRYQYPDARNPTYPKELRQNPLPKANSNTPYMHPASYAQASYPDQQPQPDPRYAVQGQQPYYQPQDRYYPPTMNDYAYQEPEDDGARSRRSRKDRPTMRSRSSHQGDRYQPSSRHRNDGDDSDMASMDYARSSHSGRSSQRKHGDESRRARSSDRNRNRDSKSSSFGNGDLKNEAGNMATDRFSMSDRGLGAGALGAVAGGVAAYKAAGGRRNKEVWGSALAGLLGAVAGGAGANALEKEYEKRKSEKDHGSGSETPRSGKGSERGGGGGAREGRTMTKWEDEGGNGFYEDKSRSSQDGRRASRSKSGRRGRKEDRQRADDYDDDDYSDESYDDKRSRRDRRRGSTYY